MESRLITPELFERKSRREDTTYLDIKSMSEKAREALFHCPAFRGFGAICSLGENPFGQISLLLVLQKAYQTKATHPDQLAPPGFLDTL
jgi:hypothetical protein